MQNVGDCEITNSKKQISNKFKKAISNTQKTEVVMLSLSKHLNRYGKNKRWVAWPVAKPLTMKERYEKFSRIHVHEAWAWHPILRLRFFIPLRFIQE